MNETPVENVRGGYLPDYTIRDTPVVAFDTSAVADIDPQTERCACGNLIEDCTPVCICEGEQ